MCAQYFEPNVHTFKCWEILKIFRNKYLHDKSMSGVFKYIFYTWNFVCISKQLWLLKFAEARAEIAGPAIRYLTPKSQLRLVCRVVQTTEASSFIFWYHENRMINYDGYRGINVSTETGMWATYIVSKIFGENYILHLEFPNSELSINEAILEHSGNYTCVPSNAEPASVLVHIFKGINYIDKNIGLT